MSGGGWSRARRWVVGVRRGRGRPPCGAATRGGCEGRPRGAAARGAARGCREGEKAGAAELPAPEDWTRQCGDGPEHCACCSGPPGLKGRRGGGVGPRCNMHSALPASWHGRSGRGRRRCRRSCPEAARPWCRRSDRARPLRRARPGESCAAARRGTRSWPAAGCRRHGRPCGDSAGRRLGGRRGPRGRLPGERPRGGVSDGTWYGSFHGGCASAAGTAASEPL